MTIIGITGGFGTGKTAAARMFKELGARVFDADKIAHDALLKKVTSYKKIVKIFGKKILKRNKEIDKKKLADIVFKNKFLLHKLNNIIHPYVIKRIKEGIKGIKGRDPDAVIILDVPLLIEAGLLALVDKLIVVKSDRKVQAERCRKKMGLSKKGVLARIRAQMPIAEKVKFADFIIDNSGTKSQTKREVRKIWREILQQATRKKRI